MRLVLNMALFADREIKKECSPDTLCAQGEFVVHPTAVGAYMLAMAQRNIQLSLALSGREMHEDKLGTLICNLSLITKTPRRLSRIRYTSPYTEFYDSTSAQGISGAMESAIQLLPHIAEADMLLRVLGKFASVGNCAVAPKGTRAVLTTMIKQLTTIHDNHK